MLTGSSMKITWDEAKRRANIDKHGLDFSDLTPDFFMNSLVVTAKEGRFAAIGKLDDGTIVVIFAKRGTQGVSVISMRPASPKERRLI